jgi:holo-[acyl-carrier-protein] synthase
VILGCGIDVMEVARFEREVARRGDGLAEELFSGSERAWCRRRRRPAEGYAMAYAAKEALFKALGTGKVGRMAWNDIEVAWSEGDHEPAVTLSGETASVAAAAGVTGLHAAVTTTREHAVAWVVLTGLGTRDSGFVSHAETTGPGFTAEPPEPQAPSPERRQSREDP